MILDCCLLIHKPKARKSFPFTFLPQTGPSFKEYNIGCLFSVHIRLFSKHSLGYNLQIPQRRPVLQVLQIASHTFLHLQVLFCLARTAPLILTLFKSINQYPFHPDFKCIRHKLRMKFLTCSYTHFYSKIFI